MTYNSEIIILNDTPERGTVTGKRMRLTGTQGKLYAKTIDKIYKFERWETPAGQVVSTDNPLVIDDWSHQFLRVVFGHVMLDDQMFADRDAIATQTYMLESLGLETSIPVGNGEKYYSQKNIAGPATVTTTYGVTFPTGCRTYGFREPDATWDPDGTPEHVNHRGTHTGWWARSPRDFEFAPVSGFPAEKFNIGYNAKFKRRFARRQYRRLNASASLYGFGVYDISTSSYGTGTIFGAYNNPSVGSPSMYPMGEWMPMYYIQKNVGIEPVDMTGLETSEINSLNFNRGYGYGRLMYNNVHDMDAVSSLSIKKADLSDSSAGLISTREYVSWHTNGTHAYVDHGVSPTKHNTSSIAGKESPRVIEPLAYTPVRTFQLRSQYYYRDSYSYSGPHDTIRDDVTGIGKDNPHWVKKWQFVPRSGSLLWSLRYTPVEDIRFGSATSVADFSSFGVYNKNLKNLTLNAPNWDGYGKRRFAGQSMPNLKGLKSIKSIAWYENYHHSSHNIDVPFDWSGLKDATNLRSLYIQHSYDTYTRYLNLADIPPSVVNLYIHPTAYLYSDPHPGETTRHKLSIDSTQIVDRSQYKDGNEITTTNLNIISTS